MKKQGLFLPLLLAGTLAAGFATAWGIVGVWAVQVGEHVAGVERPMEHLGFLKDGTPRIYAYVDGECQYFDFDHQPVPPPQGVDLHLQRDARLPAALPIRTDRGETSWEQRIQAFTDGGSPALYWYFQSDGRPDGTAFFVGYDSKSNARVGFLGLAGFRTGPLPPLEMIPFGGDQSGQEARVFGTDHRGPSHPRGYGYQAPPSAQGDSGCLSPWDVYVLGRDGKLYHADLRKRTVRTVLEGSTIRSVVLGARAPQDDHDPIGIVPVIRTDDTVLVLSEDDQVDDRFPIPDALRGQDLMFVATTNGAAVMYRHSPKDSMATEIDYDIHWVAADGSTREVMITLPWEGGQVNQTVLFGVAAPIPVVVLGSTAFLRTKELLDNGLAATYGEALGRALAEYGLAIAIAQLIAIALATLCYRRQVRFGAGRIERIAWPLFVLVLGLPGWIGYRFGRVWPVLDRCPTCRDVVPRNCPECVRCTADFPGPVAKGTEVYA